MQAMMISPYQSVGAALEADVQAPDTWSGVKYVRTSITSAIECEQRAQDNLILNANNWISYPIINALNHIKPNPNVKSDENKLCRSFWSAMLAALDAQ